MKKETFCKKKDFFEKNGIEKEYFFKTVKNYAKCFQLFFKNCKFYTWKLNSTKIVNSTKMYEYLFLKIPAKNSSFKWSGNLLSKAARLLQYSDGKNCCWSLLRNYHCNRFASSSISCREFIVEAKKKPRFWKKHFMKTSLFRR